MGDLASEPMYVRWRRAAALGLVLIAGCGSPPNGRPSLVSTTTIATTTTVAPTTTTRVIAPPTIVTTTSSTLPAGASGQIINRVDTARQIVALTFDAGLSQSMERRLDSRQVASYANERIIDVLNEKQADATLMLGGRWVTRYPAVAAKIAGTPTIEVGTLGNTHGSFAQRCKDLTPIGRDVMVADITDGFEALKTAGITPVPYFRFPGGCSDDSALATIQPARVLVVGGDVVSGDTVGLSAVAITNTVLNRVKPGSIVTFDMTLAGAPNTHLALPGIIDGLRTKGYELVTVTELLA